ncbi:MAG: hypothetical protein ACC628_05045, partial [Pirellulaceae bacterium]
MYALLLKAKCIWHLEFAGPLAPCNGQICRREHGYAMPDAGHLQGSATISRERFLTEKFPTTYSDSGSEASTELNEIRYANHVIAVEVKDVDE